MSSEAGTFLTLMEQTCRWGVGGGEWGGGGGVGEWLMGGGGGEGGVGDGGG